MCSRESCQRSFESRWRKMPETVMSLYVCVCVSVTQLCPTLEPPGKSDFIARVNETDKQTKNVLYKLRNL